MKIMFLEIFAEAYQGNTGSSFTGWRNYKDDSKVAPGRQQAAAITSQEIRIYLPPPTQLVQCLLAGIWIYWFLTAQLCLHCIASPC